MEQEPKEMQINLSSFAIFGWILFFFMALILYTILIYDRGISKGIRFSQQSFYIEHYHSEEVSGIYPGINFMEPGQLPEGKVKKNAIRKK